MDYTNVDTHEWVSQDLDDWERTLQEIRSLVTRGEISGDGDEFTDARRKIAGILTSIQETRKMIEFKQNMVEQATADVGNAFGVDPQAMSPDGYREDLDLQGEDTSG